MATTRIPATTVSVAKVRCALAMRKPRPFMVHPEWKGAEITFGWDPSPRVDIDLAFSGDPREIERLAAWLLKAAAWIREQEGK